MQSQVSELASIIRIFEYMSFTFIMVIGFVILSIIVMYISDVTQTSQAIRKNYPVVGRFRYFFEKMGEFFRQYFFAMDREEMPFNRAIRSWVYRAAKDLENTTAFGSTRDLKPENTILFVNTAFPTLSQDAKTTRDIVIGENCKKPYHTQKIFHISGMSYGAISKPAVRSLSLGAKMAGCWMNTGEGGLSPYHLEGGADLIFQIGTAKYGIRNQNGEICKEKLVELGELEQVKMIEIKLSQGAKPGKGGILPGTKVTKEIAEIRGIAMGSDSISPNRHPDIKCTKDLLDFIELVRNTTGKPVGFKAVVGDYNWFNELLEEINRRGTDSAPDFITIDSADGGTGAAPLSLMDYMGLPISESLPRVNDLICKYKLRDRIKLIASGKLITPAEVAWALCVGADFVVSARGFMFSLGCIQAMQCNKNTCPTGITTHKKHLQKGLHVRHKSVRVANYARNMEKELAVIAHACGVQEPRELDRTHARLVIKNGQSISLAEAYRSNKTNDYNI